MKSKTLWLLPFITLGLINCTNSAEPPSDSPPATSSSPPSNVPATCSPSQPLPQDPLTLIAQSSSGAGSRRHMIEIALDFESGILYGAGTPGLESFDITPNSPELLDEHRGKMEHLELISSSLIAGTSRGRSSRQNGQIRGMGLYLFDVSDPSQIGEPTYLEIDHASGLAYRDPYLYVLSHDGKIRTIDISSSTSPEVINETSGLANPWKMVIIDTIGYIADNTLGITTVDLSNPITPILGPTVPTEGGIQDLVTDGAYLYGAMGSQGIEIFSLADPQNPESVATLELGGPVISVSLANNLLWASNQESVLVVDIADPQAPIQYAVEDTPSWAMHVHAAGDIAYVADWRSVRVMQYENGLTAPDADPSRSEIYFTESSTAQVFTLTNRGGSQLDISGMKANDQRIRIYANKLNLLPGESTDVTLHFANDGNPIDTELCIATNDPDEPVQSITLASTSSGSSVLIGENAPNFNLESLDGQYFELASQLGKPVVLCYFATW